MKPLLSATLGAALLGAGVAAATEAPSPTVPVAPTIVRGAIAQISANVVKIRTRDGKLLAIALAPDWNVQVTKPVTLDAIQPGSFIGTAEMPQANGSGRSLEVHVFPPGVKLGEGHYGWDLRKGSMMTNGTLPTVPGAHRTREIDVSYATGTRHIVVPANVPIVQITPGARDMARPGVSVFLIAVKTPSGALATNGLAIGEGGRAPPM